MVYFRWPNKLTQVLVRFPDCKSPVISAGTLIYFKLPRRFAVQFNKFLPYAKGNIITHQQRVQFDIYTAVEPTLF